MRKSAALAAVFVAGFAHAAGPQHFTLSASYAPPAKLASNGTIAISFVATDPEIHVNEAPAPRLRLDPAQTILVDKQALPPERVTPYDPATAKYLDLTLPLTFPVALAKGAPKGAQSVAAIVTYFYCSTREGWCRKGNTEIAVTVRVP